MHNRHYPAKISASCGTCGLVTSRRSGIDLWLALQADSTADRRF